MPRRPKNSDVPKKKRGLLDGYKTYDPKVEGYGNVNEWRSRWEAMTGAEAHVILGVGSTMDQTLAILGLTTMPTTVREVQDAYRSMSKTAHPDQGGSDEAFRRLHAAYTIIKEEVES